MGRKKKPKAPDAEAREAEARRAEKASQPLGTSLASVLKRVSLEPPAEAAPRKSPARTTRDTPPKAAAPAPSPAPVPPAGAARPSDTLRGDDKIAFHQAMNGVRPLAREDAATSRPTRVSRPAPEATAADEEARARLGALVAGGIRFEVAHDGDRILGRRAGLPLRLADDLSQKHVVPEATLDLHGRRGEEATREVVRFVRAQQRRGARHVCVVHGKGLHNETGLSILRDHVVAALTEGGAAPAVRAFASAHRTRGGTGALIVLLEV